MSTHVEVTISDSVALVRLNRPTMNVLNRAMRDEITHVCEQLESNNDVRAVVIYGGDHLAAGADVKEMAAWGKDEVDREAPLVQEAFNAISYLPMPTIAAITGYSLGGGLELALSCDLRIAADSAQMGQPEILLGIITGAGGTQRLSRLIGPSRAKDLIFTGRLVSAVEALQMGLVNEVVESDRVLDRALELARMLATRPRLAIRAAKLAIDNGLDLPLHEGLEIEVNLFTKLFGTNDQVHGMSSFIENGPGKATFE